MEINHTIVEKDKYMRAMIVRRMRQLLNENQDIAHRVFKNSNMTYIQFLNNLDPIKDEDIIELFELIVRAVNRQR